MPKELLLVLCALIFLVIECAAGLAFPVGYWVDRDSKPLNIDKPNPDSLFG
jgi:hypothetical protein